MKTCGLPFIPFFVLFVVASTFVLSCGSSNRITVPGCGSFASSNETGSLQSVTVCPAVADAQGSSIQFTAIGTYTTSPSPALMPTGVIWGACQQGQLTSDVTVANGLAKCASGASGTYTVWATGNPVCNVIGPCGACGPTGNAELTCP